MATRNSAGAKGGRVSIIPHLAPRQHYSVTKLLMSRWLSEAFVHGKNDMWNKHFQEWLREKIKQLEEK